MRGTSAHIIPEGDMFGVT